MTLHSLSLAFLLFPNPPLPLPFHPSPPLFLPAPPPSLRSRFPLFQLEGLGNTVSCPSGVSGGALADIDFNAF